MADEDAALIPPTAPVGTDSFFRDNAGAVPFKKSTWDQILTATGVVAPVRPINTTELQAAIAAGDTWISLAYLSVITANVVLPPEMMWDPPKEGSPIDLQAASGRLELYGPCSQDPHYQLFTNFASDSVVGHFGGREINCAWWLGSDWAAVADAAAGITAACNAGRGDSEATLMNAGVGSFDMTVRSYRGGDVRLPPGRWVVGSTITLGLDYVVLKGSGQNSVIHFKGVDIGPGFDIPSGFAGGGVRRMQILIDDDCHATFDLFDVEDNYLERCLFEDLIIRGCKRHIAYHHGSGTNHCEYNRIECVGPHEVNSTAFFLDSSANNVTIRNFTVANIAYDGTWDQAFHIEGGRRVRIGPGHIESCRIAAVLVTHGSANVTVDSVDFNHWNNYKWVNKGAWVNSTDYAVDEKVTHGATWYFALVVSGPGETAFYEPGVTSGWATYWEDGDKHSPDIDGAPLVRVDPDSGNGAAVQIINSFNFNSTISLKDDRHLSGVRLGGNANLDDEGELHNPDSGSRKIMSASMGGDGFWLNLSGPPPDKATSKNNYTVNIADDVTLAAGWWSVTVSATDYDTATVVLSDEEDEVIPGFSGVSSGTVTRTFYHGGGDVLVTLTGAGVSTDIDVDFTPKGRLT